MYGTRVASLEAEADTLDAALKAARGEAAERSQQVAELQAEVARCR